MADDAEAGGVLAAAAEGEAAAAAPEEAKGEEEAADKFADSEAWLAKMIVAIKNIKKTDDGKIDLESYLAAMEEVTPVYSALFTSGMVVRQLKSDLVGSIEGVREAAKSHGDKGATLTDMVNAEIEKLTLKKCQTMKKNGVKCLLWLNRATSFLAVFVHGLVDGKLSKQAAGDAYETTLKPFHGWMARKIVGTAMGMCPKREVIFPKLGCKDEAEAMEMAVPFLGQFEPLVKAVLDLLESVNANFPDKA